MRRADSAQRQRPRSETAAEHMDVAEELEAREESAASSSLQSKLGDCAKPSPNQKKK